MSALRVPQRRLPWELGIISVSTSRFFFGHPSPILKQRYLKFPKYKFMQFLCWCPAVCPSALHLQIPSRCSCMYRSAAYSYGVGIAMHLESLTDSAHEWWKQQLKHPQPCRDLLLPGMPNNAGIHHPRRNITVYIQPSFFPIDFPSLCRSMKCAAVSCTAFRIFLEEACKFSPRQTGFWSHTFIVSGELLTKTIG